MRSNLIKLLQDVRASYWFIPTLFLFAAIVLARVTIWLDLILAMETISKIPFFEVVYPEGARAVLTTIAGSIIGVAGVTFSITIATVSFASGNYGPRLIGNFMRDRGNQVILGVFIATFIYCLLVLRTVRSEGENGALFVPHLSLMTAMVLSLTAIGFLIYFFHHVPESIDIQRLTASLGRGLRNQVCNLFPNDYDGRDEDEDGAEPWLKAMGKREAVPIAAGQTGFVRGFAASQAERLADKHDLYLSLAYRPGDFLTHEDVALHAYPAKGAEISNELKEQLQNLFALGDQRTPGQNVLFRVDTLVEIASRALSPGINDPQTAIACFDWLRGAANVFARRSAEAGIAEDGTAHRLRVSPVTFAAFVHHAFARPRPYVAADRNASFHVLHCLAECALPLPDGSRRACLIDEMDALVAEAEKTSAKTRWVEDLRLRRQEIASLLNAHADNRTLTQLPHWLGGRG
jgi:uncharacterized membrane protein